MRKQNNDKQSIGQKVKNKNHGKKVYYQGDKKEDRKTKRVMGTKNNQNKKKRKKFIIKGHQ